VRSERWGIGLALLLLMSCSKPQPVEPAATQAAATTTSANGPRIILPDGFPVHVELATEDETRAQGLMFRDRLPAGTGMIFFFNETGEYPFWMKNTLIPLDMIWIADDKRVAAIIPDVPPCKADPCPSYPPNAPSKYVLELAAGEAKKHKLSVGEVLRFEGMDHVVVR